MDRISSLRSFLIGLLVLAAGSAVTLPSFSGGGEAHAATDPVVWVNDAGYGSAGKGFYHDFVSGQEWTAERGWHSFSPQPPRPNPQPLWVNYLTYGSAGGGFYLDPQSGQVWTAERGWHLFDPRPPLAGISTTRPTQAPPVVLSWGWFCVGNNGCTGPGIISPGQPITASIAFDRTPAGQLTAGYYINGAYQFELEADPPPYAGPAFNTGATLGSAPVGTIELRLYVGGVYVNSVKLTIAGNPPGSGFTSPPGPTATPYRPPAVPTATTVTYGPRRGAVCKDGTVSTATGSGACSWHGGVAYWLY